MRARGKTMAIAAMLVGLTAPAALAVGQSDPGGDVRPSDGKPPLLTAAQSQAIDLAAIDAVVGDELTVTVTVHGKHANRKVSDVSGHGVTFWQGENDFWAFYWFDSGPEYFSLTGAESDGELFASCEGWTVVENASVATYKIAAECFPNVDATQPVMWAVAAGWTSDDDGSSWSDEAPDQPSEGADFEDLVSAPVLDFTGYADGSQKPEPQPEPEPEPTRPTPTARDISATCDDKPAKTDFSDTNGTAHEYTIDCVSAYDVAQGRVDGTFGPGDMLTRGQTATFLVRALEAAGHEVPGPAGFCEGDAVHTDSYDRLLAAGIVPLPSGGDCGIATKISRGEMAQWVHDALLWTDASFGPSQDWFLDDEGHEYEDAINVVAGLGIVTGIGDSKFGPDNTLSRGQMATFLARLLDTMFTAA